MPITALGWPEKTPDLDALYPNDILETGSDILFFWVARMVMMCYGLEGKFPFKTIFLHNIVMDKEGKKMSKSRGNVIDPVEIIEGCPLDTLLNRI